MRVRRNTPRFARVLQLMDHRKWVHLASITIWGVVLAFCFNLVMAFVFQDVLNASLAGDFSLHIRAIVLALATFILGMPIASLGRYGITIATLRTITAIRARLFSVINRLPMARLGERHSGDLVSRTTNDVETIRNMFMGTMTGFTQGIAQGTIGLAAVFALEWRLGLVSITCGLAFCTLSTAYARMLRIRSDKLQSSVASMTERLSDLLSGVRVTRMLRLEETIHHQYTAASNEAARRTIDHARSKATFDALQSLLEWIQQISVLGLGLLLFSHGQILVGAVYAIVRLQGNASFLFQYFGQFLTSIQRGLSGGSRVLEVLELPVEVETVRTVAAQPTDASVVLRDVSFAYDPDTDRSTLMSVSLAATTGEVVALVGPSGGGKSTLLRLLLGFYPPSAGEIRVGGLSVSEGRLHAHRRLMAYVSQDAYLFTGTIRENIGYGKPGASEAEIVEAAKAANAHGFILEQPDGYQTDIGEAGANLSGGQKQRIAIARALLRDAPILLLDEATSALDSESERLVQEALDVLMQGRTTIAVAHRLSTIAHADRIYVLNDGRIAEEGRHDDLLAAGGVYRRLHDLQFAVNTEEAF